MARSYDAGKMDVLTGIDGVPSRGDMAMMTPRHPKKAVKHPKSESAAARAEQARGKRKDHQSKALSYF